MCIRDRTVAFSQSIDKIKKINIKNYVRESITSADLDERQLAALGLYWNEGRYWTKVEEDEEARSEEESESGSLPEMEEAGELGAGTKEAYASVVASQAERAAVAAASEARVAVEAAAQLEAAMAAAELAKGGAEAALLAREVAEIEAATAAHDEAQEVLAC